MILPLQFMYYDSFEGTFNMYPTYKILREHIWDIKQIKGYSSWDSANIAIYDKETKKVIYEQQGFYKSTEDRDIFDEIIYLSIYDKYYAINKPKQCIYDENKNILRLIKNIIYNHNKNHRTIFTLSEYDVELYKSGKMINLLIHWIANTEGKNISEYGAVNTTDIIFGR